MSIPAPPGWFWWEVGGGLALLAGFSGYSVLTTMRTMAKRGANESG